MKKHILNDLFPIKLALVFPELYAVGGCVRDCFLGLKPKDVDFAIELPPEEVLARAQKAGLSVVPTGIEHGTVTVFVEKVGYEITTFRKDVSCGGRKATVNFSNSIQDDLERRDFTINAMAYSYSDKSLIRVRSAAHDLAMKIIRTVGNPYDRFTEDYLRIIRMARFAARLSFSIEPETWKAAKECAPKLLEHVSAERIFMEFDKAFAHENAGKFIRLLTELGLFELIFPEYEGFEKMAQDPIHHPEGPVSEHVYQVVDRIAPKYRWHALLHDVGKPKVFKEFGTYLGHDKVGVELIDGIADRLKFSNNLRESTKNTTKYHMYPVMMSSCGINKRICRRFQSKVLPFLDELREVVKADKGERFSEVAEMFEELPTQIKPILTGKHLIEKGIKPGAELGVRLKKAFDYQIEEGVEDIEELLKIALAN